MTPLPHSLSLEGSGMNSVPYMVFFTHIVLGLANQPPPTPPYEGGELSTTSNTRGLKSAKTGNDTITR
jgi:hypothetical protein